ncbi:MAG TPA: hypothetical protein VI076_17275 [Actinopolymorphaceae bacterium]
MVGFAERIVPRGARGFVTGVLVAVGCLGLAAGVDARGGVEADVGVTAEVSAQAVPCIDPASADQICVVPKWASAL